MAFFLFTGCGKGDAPSGGSASNQAEFPSGGTASGQGESSASGSSSGQVQGSTNMPITKGDALFLKEYIPLELSFPDSGNYWKIVHADSYGSKFYLLSAYQEKDNEEDCWQYFMNIIDGNTHYMEQKNFFLEIPGKEDFRVLSMEVKGDNELSFHLGKEVGEEYHHFLAVTDLKGNLELLEEDFSAKMQEKDAIIGGESSGGLTVKGHISGKDGIYAAMLLVEMIALTGKKLSEIMEEIRRECGAIYMEERDYKFNQKKKEDMQALLMEEKKLPQLPFEIEHVSYMDGSKVYFKNGGWVIARFSGTEPLLRIFCEMPEMEDAKKVCGIYEQFLDIC